MSQLLETPLASQTRFDQSSVTAEPGLYRWTPSQFRQIVELGLLDPKNSYELLDGEIVQSRGPDLTLEDKAWGARRGTIYRWSLTQYDRMAEAGLLTPEDHTELLEGVIVQDMSIGPPHVFVVELFMELLIPLLPKWLKLRLEHPIVVHHSEPEPDIAIVRREDYLTRHPEGTESLFVIEVAESSLPLDRKKAAYYAKAGVPEYWIINLLERQIEQYTQPDAEAQRYLRTEIRREDELVSMIIAGETIGEWSVESLLPPTKPDQ